MRPLFCGLLALSLVVGAGRAADPPAKAPAGSPEFEALKKEFEQAQNKFQQSQAVKDAVKQAQEAQNDVERQAAMKKIKAVEAEAPAHQYAGRFIEFARKHPKDSSAFASLMMALQLSGGPTATNGVWAKAFDALESGFAARPEVAQLLPALGRSSDPVSDKFLRTVAAKNPDRKVQARAVKTLINRYQTSTEMAERLENNPAMRKNVEQSAGKEAVEQILAYAKQSKEETPKLKKTLTEKYADIFPDLSVGKKAPEVVSHDLEGKEVRLSALKGKVVVLDIWATWCGPCRQMIPHERRLVERLKDKPFVLVSIDCDADKGTLTKFLTKEPMPWTHWYNGEGGITETWDVQFFPTIYVLDAQGVIRYKDVRGDDMDKAVDTLLKEMEAKK